MTQGIARRAAFFVRPAQNRLNNVPSTGAPRAWLLTQAVLQGSFVLAKAKHGPAIAAECIEHLRRYLEMLFTDAKNRNGGE